MIPCAPLLALLSPRLTAAGVFANLVAAPLGEAVALPFCLLHGLLAPLPPLERAVAAVGSGALLVVRHIAHLGASARWLTCEVPLPGAWHFAVILAGAAGALLARDARWRSAWLIGTAFGLGVVERATIHAERPLGELRITVLDVGQGDGILVDLPDGRLMLVDAGPDPGAGALISLLRARRRSQIDVAVITHRHPDHTGGITSVIERVGVAEIWHAEPLPDQLRVLAQARGVPLRAPPDLCRMPHRFGAAAVSVLAPCPLDGQTGNDASIVLQIRQGSRSVLLTGDAGLVTERQLLRSRVDLRSDLLKVGHHGSASSTGREWLGAVTPSVAVISVGVRNRFGHPSPIVIERLRQVAALPLRTDLCGGVEWRTDGRTVRVTTVD
jgi:competence protein ComEC